MEEQVFCYANLINHVQLFQKIKKTEKNYVCQYYKIIYVKLGTDKQSKSTSFH